MAIFTPRRRTGAAITNRRGKTKMKRIKRIAYWLAFNGIFAAAVYFGVVKGVTGAQRIASFMIWTTFTMSFAWFSDDVVRYAQKAGVPVSRGINFAYDIAILAVLVWFGWGWSAGAYAIHMLFRDRRFMKLPEPKDAATQA